MTFRAEITGDHIALYDGTLELVYWDEAEWAEDPTLVPAIARALQIGYMEGAGAVAIIIAKGMGTPKGWQPAGASSGEASTGHAATAGEASADESRDDSGDEALAASGTTLTGGQQDLLRQVAGDEVLLGIGTRAVKAELDDLRDRAMWLGLHSNGFVVRWKDRRPSTLIRFGPVTGVRIALEAIAGGSGGDDESTGLTREQRDFLRRARDSDVLMEAGRKAVEDTLIEMRDLGLEADDAHGLACKDEDETPSMAIRLTVPAGLAVALKAIAEVTPARLQALDALLAGEPAACGHCGAVITLLDGDWTDEDGCVACTDASAPFVPHRPAPGAAAEAEG